MTPSKRTANRPSGAEAAGGTKPTGPEASARYTPPTPAYRVRPRWHRLAGWAGIVLGVVVAALNDVMLMGENVTLLPGGHSELYLMLGIAVAAGATWFLGLFDRGTTIFD